MRKEITIPGAGESRNFSIKGVSLIIESIPVYSGHEEVPVFGFNQPGANYPLYPYSTYNANGEQFKSVSITGTAESAGNTVVVISVNDCLPNQIKPGFKADAAAAGGDGGTRPGLTFAKTVTDAPQYFEDIELQENNFLPKRILLRAVDFSVHLSFGKDADQTKYNEILKAGLDEPYKIEGMKQIRGLSFANAGAGSNATLIVTPIYYL